MLDVDIEKIIPVTEARDTLNEIISAVEGSDDLYVITKNGKPSAIIVGVHHLEKLTGMSHKELMLDENDEPAEESAKPAESDIAKNTDDVADAYPSTPVPAEDDIFAPPLTPATDETFPTPEPVETPLAPAPTNVDSTVNDIYSTPAPAIAPATVPLTPAEPAINIPVSTPVDTANANPMPSNTASMVGGYDTAIVDPAPASPYNANPNSSTPVSTNQNPPTSNSF